ncbi:MAG: hypothetical protein M1817_004885 [Caeruleum heppii]|nr:MAG: hypothetical protein M1817_004885 [Caeruleum heppii]
MPPELRKTRFVCVSDTHNASPSDGAFVLPAGDVLVHAGDLTNQGTFGELSRAIKWIEESNFEAKIVIAGNNIDTTFVRMGAYGPGNHDITLDQTFYAEHGNRFHNQQMQDPKACLRLVRAAKTITYLDHESTVVRLSSARGPQTTFKVFGSPLSPGRDKWAFGYTSDNAHDVWKDLSSDANVVVTHTPPAGHCDASPDRGASGCPGLHEALCRVQPRLAICGHVHEGRGVDHVQWKQRTRVNDDIEAASRAWDDPGRGNKKLSLVDLTAKAINADRASSARPTSGVLSHDDKSSDDKVGVRETCVVNAAITASSWSHKAKGGKKVNKPIVVDLDLPTWQDSVVDIRI